MGWLDSPIAVGKWLVRFVVGLVLLPIRLPRRLFRALGRIRGASAPTAALSALAVLLAAVAGAGVLYATTATTEVSASSAPIISAILEWTTNGWGYVLAAIVFGRGTVWGLRRARIARAAQETGYSPRTIARMADEIRTADGTERAIIFGDDSHADATDRILDALSGDGDTLTQTSPEAESSDALSLPAPADENDDTPAESDESMADAERFKLWRMDLATALRTDSIVWKLLVPAAIVFVIELVLVQFWVRWWLYPSMAAGALLVGLLVYKVDQWRRKRRLNALRQDRAGETWEEISVLVKTVSTDEKTVHMGYLAGRRYAATDRDELAETLATRALERSRGYHPSPAIEERYAWCLDRYILNFRGWRENKEKPDIMDRLVNEVLDSEEGMIPKEVLADRVVEHDRRYIWQGLRFVGYGYDPDLVAECYADLVPSALVERDFAIQTPDGERTVTAVRARTEPLPPDVAQLRANFSERFRIRSLPARYDLPSIDPERDRRGFRIPT